MGGVYNTIKGDPNQFHATRPYDWGTLQQSINQQAQTQADQGALAQALRAQMAGAGPNPAELLYQQQAQKNIAGAQGLIASQRGLNPALAAKMGANVAASQNQQAGLNTALLRQQQQLAAQQQLGGLYGQMQQGALAQQGLVNQANLGAMGINAGVAGQNAQIGAGLTGGLINAAGGVAAKAAGGAAHGGKVQGKSKVSGDSEENDTVPAMLSPGEIVVPRSKAHDPEKAKEFIDHLLKNKDEEKPGYGKVLEHKRKMAELEKRIKALESKKAKK